MVLNTFFFSQTEHISKWLLYPEIGHFLGPFLLLCRSFGPKSDPDNYSHEFLCVLKITFISQRNYEVEELLKGMYVLAVVLVWIKIALIDSCF